MGQDDDFTPPDVQIEIQLNRLSYVLLIGEEHRTFIIELVVVRLESKCT